MSKFIYFTSQSKEIKPNETKLKMKEKEERNVIGSSYCLLVKEEFHAEMSTRAIQ